MEDPYLIENLKQDVTPTLAQKNSTVGKNWSLARVQAAIAMRLCFYGILHSGLRVFFLLILGCAAHGSFVL